MKMHLESENKNESALDEKQVGTFNHRQQEIALTLENKTGGIKTEKHNCTEQKSRKSGYRCKLILSPLSLKPAVIVCFINIKLAVNLCYLWKTPNQYS